MMRKGQEVGGRSRRSLTLTLALSFLYHAFPFPDQVSE